MLPTDGESFPVFCILTELKKVLNFTEYHHRPSEGLGLRIDASKPPGWAAILFIMLVPKNVKTLLAHSWPVTYTFINHGMTTATPCFGTVVTPTKHSGLDGLLKPFGGTTWLCLTLSVVALLAFQRILNHTGLPREATIEPIRLLFLLLSQCLIELKCAHLNFKVLVTIPVWYFMSVILSSIYQGELFGYLSLIRVPRGPGNVTQLVHSGLPFWTTSMARSGSTATGKLEVVFLLSTILDSLLKDRNLKFSEKVSFFRLNESLQTFGDLMKPTSVHQSVIRLFGDMRNSNEMASSDVVYMDADKQVAQFAQLIALFSSNVFVDHRKLSMLDLRLMWVTRRNFFLRVTAPFFQSIHESGLYSLWDRYYGIRKLYSFLKDASEQLGRDMQKPTSFLNPNIFGFVISDAGKQQMGSDYGEFEPISLKTFKVAALIWTYCILLSTLGFLGEKFRKDYKSFVSKIRILWALIAFKCLSACCRINKWRQHLCQVFIFKSWLKNRWYSFITHAYVPNQPGKAC